MRDLEETPTILRSEGKLTCTSDLIDILILSNSNSGLASGDDLTLISSNPICGDSHFYSGGEFALLNPDGGYADFISFVDPIVSSSRGCSFGSYTGVSLKVEAMRAITCTGSITITGRDLTATGDSDSSILTSSAALILRADLDSLEHSSNVPINYGGTTFQRKNTSGSIITLTGNITTAGGPVMLYPNAAGTGNVALDGNIQISTSGGNITIGGTVNSESSARTLTLNSGSGNISISGAIGNTLALTTLTIANANNASFNNVTAGSIVQSAGSGTSSFGVINTTAIGGISLTGSGFTFNNTVTTAAVGPVIINNSGANTITSGSNFSVSGAFNQNGSGPSSLAANITTSNTNLSFLGAITVAGSSTLSSGAGAGNITLSSTINGAQPLVLTGGSGNITLSGIVGGTTALSSLTVTGNLLSLSNIGGASAGISGSTSLTSTGSTTFTGSTYNANVQTYTAGTTFNMNAGALTTFTSTNDAITFTSGVIELSSSTNLSINSAGGNITLPNIDAVSGDLRTLTLNAGTGTLQVGSIGTERVSEFTLLSLAGGDLKLYGNLVTGNLTLTPGGSNSIYLGGNITTSNSNITFSRPVIRDRTDSVTLSTGVGAGNIAFSSTLDGDVDNTRSLLLSSGTGSVVLSGALGGVHPLNNLTIITAADVTASAVSSVSLTQNAGTGTTTFNGPVSTTGIGGISLTGSAFTFNNTVTTSGAGNMSVANSGLLTLSAPATLTLGSRFDQTGSGAVSLANSITTADGGMTFSSPVTLSGNTLLNTSGTDKSIVFSSTINGGNDLTMTCGNGNITIGGDVGATTRIGALHIISANDISFQSLTTESIALDSSSGLTIFNSFIDTNGAAGMTLVGTNFERYGSITISNGGSLHITNSGTGSGLGGLLVDVSDSFVQSGTGAMNLYMDVTTHTGDITFEAPITLMGPCTFDSSEGGGDIHFTGTINGSGSLTLDAGAGDIISDGIIGGTTPVGAITINSAADVTLQAVSATSINQLDGTGLTDFQGDVATTGVAGISVKTASVTRGASISTTGGGPVTVDISGTFTSTAAGSYNLTGPLVQISHGAGSPSVVLAGEIFVADHSISFASPITLLGDTDIDSGVTGADITISSTVNGAYIFEVCPVSGDLLISGDIGGIVPVTTFEIKQVADANVQKVYAADIVQIEGTGTTTFNDLISTSGASGISLQGVNFTFENSITTTGGGPLLLNSSSGGVSTFNGTGIIDGAFSIVGGGSAILSSSITSAGTMQFLGPVSITGTASLSTQAADESIYFFDTLDGSGDLTLSLGAGDLYFQAAVGGNTSLGAVVIQTVHNVTTEAFTSTSLTQNAGTGISLFQGALITSAVGGIDLTGSVFTFAGDVTTTNAGPIAISNTGALTFTAGKAVTSDGAFAQSNLVTGTVSLAGTITTNNLDLSIESPVTLTSSSILSSGAGDGDITLSSTVDGARDLTLTAGTGDINLYGDVGSVTRVGAVTVNSAANLNIGTGLVDADITAISVSVGAVTPITGTVTINGNFNTNGANGMIFRGNNLYRNGDFITTNGGSLTINNTGSITGVPGNTTTIDGSFTQDGTGPVGMAGTLTVNTGNISFSGPINMGGTALLTTGSGAGNVTISNTINGAQSLTINTGGDIFLNGDVGVTIPLNLLDIKAATNFTAEKINAVKIVVGSITDITGAATFNDEINTSGADGIAVNGNVVDINANMTTTGTGTLAITNSGELTIDSGVTFSLDGAFSQTGGGAVSLGGSISTTNDNISFDYPVTLIANCSLDSGSGAGDITFASRLGGVYTIELTAGSGDVDFQDTIGVLMPPAGVTIVSATDVTASGSVTVAGPLNITSATGDVTFSGLVSTTTADGISLSGVNFTFAEGITTTNSGPIAISNSGALTFPSGKTVSSNSTFTQTDLLSSGTVSLGGTIVTNNADLSFSSPITLTAATILNSGSGDGNIEVSNTIEGTLSATQSITFTSGLGDILVTEDIGGTVRLGNVILTEARDVTVESITALSISQQSGTRTSTLNGSFNTTGIAGINMVGVNFVRNGDLITTGGGSVIVTNSGSITGAGLNTTNISGSYIQNGTGSIDLGGVIRTLGQISLAGDITLLADTTLDSTNDGGGTGSDIICTGTIDGDYSFTVISGTTGVIELEGLMGSTTALDSFTASGLSVHQYSSLITTGAVQETGVMNIHGDITTTNSNITLTGKVTFGETSTITLSTGAGIGDITITGALNGDVSGRNLVLDAGIGGVTLGDTAGGSVPFNDFTVSGDTIALENFGAGSPGATGTVSLEAITTIDFNGTVYTSAIQNYTAGTDFNFDAGALTTITSNNKNITFSTGTLNLSADNHLTINSNGGNIILSPVMVPLADPGSGVIDLIGDALTGNITVTQIGAPTNYLNSVDLTGTVITHPDPIYADNIDYNSPTVLQIGSNQTYSGGTVYNSPIEIIADNVSFIWDGITPGDLTFSKAINGDGSHAGDIVISPDPDNNIVFSGPIGGIEPLSSITIEAVTDVTIGSTVNVGSFSQTGGTGTTTISAGITSTAAAGISIETAIMTLMGSFSTANNGAVTLNNSGVLTTPGCIDIDSSGAFQQIGAGEVTICGNITTHDAEISFDANVTLGDDITLVSIDATGGDVSFGGTINGTVANLQNLYITAGSGDITVTGAIGGGTRLGHFEFYSAHDVTLAATSVYCLEQFAGTGVTTLNGAVNINSNEGLNFTGSALSINSSVTTTDNGPISIDNAGTLTLTSSANCVVNGTFIQSGSGESSLAGAITADGAISFATPAVLSDAFILDSSANDQNITFSSTIKGPGDFTAIAGSGNLQILGEVGEIGVLRLGVFTITSAEDVSTLGIIAESIEQTAGSGVTTINGNLNTNAISGISLTGTSFSLDGDMITTNSGSVAIVNSSSLALTGGSNTSITGSFTQSGGGSVSFGGTLITDAQAISFANAVTLSSASSISSGAGIGNITFTSTVDGNQSLSLTAGTGDIIFGDSLGYTSALDSLTIASVRDVTYPSLRAFSITQSNSSGTTTISGTEMRTLGVGGISIKGGIINQDAAITTLAEGSIVIDNSALFTIAANTNCSGSYIQSGAGDVDLNGLLLAVSDDITFTGAVTLSSSSSISTSVNVGDIHFISTIDGTTLNTEDLTLTASSGSIYLDDDVGSTIALKNIIISSATDVTAEAITASSITQTNGTGVTTFNGAIDSTNAVSLSGTAFTIANTFQTTNDGLSVNNTGILTLTSAADLQLDGALVQNGTGAVSLNGSVVAGGAISFVGAVTAEAGGTANLSTAAANQPITFLNTVDGSGNLTLASGTEDITFEFDVGSLTRLGTLTITSAGDLLTKNITALSISQVAGASSIFDGDLDTSGALGIDLNGGIFIFEGSSTTAASGPVTITNAGLLTFSPNESITSDGAFTQDGVGSVSLGGNITTTNDNISFATAVTLTGAIELSTGDGLGNITLSSTVDGARDLTLTAGTGDINLYGDVGSVTPVGAVTVNSAANLNIGTALVDADITAISVSVGAVTPITGTVTINGNFNTNGANGMIFKGNNLYRNGDFITTNGGSLTITNTGSITGVPGNTTTIDGSFTQDGTGPVGMAGTLTANTGNISFSGPINMGGTALLTTGSGAGNVTISNTINGAQSLTVTAGAGSVTFSQTIGGSTGLSSLTLSGNNITVADIGSLGAGVTGLINFTANNDISFSGTTYNANQQTYTAGNCFNINAAALTTFTSSGDAITFTGNNGIYLATDSDLTINSAGGIISLDNIYAQSGDLRTLILNSGATNLQVGIIGVADDSEFASVSFSGADITLTNDIFADVLELTPTGTLYAGGNIYTTNSPIHFPTAVVLTGSKVFSSGATTGGNITFDSSLNGDIDDTHTLTLVAHSSDITFTGAVGAVHPLKEISITSRP